jgi:hypothetical protein
MMPFLYEYVYAQQLQGKDHKPMHENIYLHSNFVVDIVIDNALSHKESVTKTVKHETYCIPALRSSIKSKSLNNFSSSTSQNKKKMSASVRINKNQMRSKSIPGSRWENGLHAVEKSECHFSLQRQSMLSPLLLSTCTTAKRRSQTQPSPKADIAPRIPNRRHNSCTAQIDILIAAIDEMLLIESI